MTAVATVEEALEHNGPLLDRFESKRRYLAAKVESLRGKWADRVPESVDWFDAIGASMPFDAPAFDPDLSRTLQSATRRLNALDGEITKVVTACHQRYAQLREDDGDRRAAAADSSRELSVPSRTFSTLSDQRSLDLDEPEVLQDEEDKFGGDLASKAPQAEVRVSQVSEILDRGRRESEGGVECEIAERLFERALNAATAVEFDEVKSRARLAVDTALQVAEIRAEAQALLRQLDGLSTPVIEARREQLRGVMFMEQPEASEVVSPLSDELRSVIKTEISEAARAKLQAALAKEGYELFREPDRAAPSYLRRVRNDAGSAVRIRVDEQGIILTPLTSHEDLSADRQKAVDEETCDVAREIEELGRDHGFAVEVTYACGVGERAVEVVDLPEVVSGNIDNKRHGGNASFRDGGLSE